MTVFILSSATVTFFNGSIIGMFYKYWKGINGKESLLSIVQIYLMIE